MRYSILLLSVFIIAGCATTPTAVILPVPTASLTEPAPNNTSIPTTESLPTDPAKSVIEFPDPSRVRWEPLTGDFRNSLYLGHAGDDRLFIVEQDGVIWIVEGDTRIEQPFLDIRDRVGATANERGLLGLAFHPDYARSAAFFVYYTDLAGDTVISRFLRSDSDPNRADPDSERVLLKIGQPFANHNGGGLVFGPDGFLYIATGDGGSAGDPNGAGQSRDTLLGKILRIDVDSGDPYVIPSSNPFVNGDGLPEIWAFGLRNPWRISFDRLTGDLFIGDVGQNQWEEINFQPVTAVGGENYGWNIREGRHSFAGEKTPDMVDPIAEYDHSAGCSVTGGYVVRDPDLPEWAGVYLFGDYCTGVIWGTIQNAAGEWVTRPLFESGVRISSFGEDAGGRIYLVDHAGTVFRLQSGE